jgi:hypothetical protein
VGWTTSSIQATPYGSSARQIAIAALTSQREWASIIRSRRDPTRPRIASTHARPAASSFGVRSCPTGPIADHPAGPVTSSDAICGAKRSHGQTFMPV